MPELEFKGKEFDRNHHLTVQHRQMVPDAEKSVGEPNLDGNIRQKILGADAVAYLVALSY